MPRVVVGIPRGRMKVHPRWWPAVTSEAESVGCHDVWQIRDGINGPSREDLCHKRSVITSRAISAGASFLIMVDDDVIPPYGSFERLVRHLKTDGSLGAVNALCFRKSRHPSALLFPAMEEVGQRVKVRSQTTHGVTFETITFGSRHFAEQAGIDEIRPGRLTPAESLGAGLVAFRVDAMAKTGAEWTWDHGVVMRSTRKGVAATTRTRTHHGEDTTYSMRLAAMGWGLATDCSVIPAHVELQKSLAWRIYPTLEWLSAKWGLESVTYPDGVM